MRSSEKIAGTENLVYTLNSPGFGIPAYKFQGAAALCCELLNTRLIRLRGYSVQSEGLLPSIWNTESIAVWIAFVVFENTFSLSHLHILTMAQAWLHKPTPQKRGGWVLWNVIHTHALPPNTKIQTYKNTKTQTLYLRGFFGLLQIAPGLTLLFTYSAMWPCVHWCWKCTTTSMWHRHLNALLFKYITLLIAHWCCFFLRSAVRKSSPYNRNPLRESCSMDIDKLKYLGGTNLISQLEEALENIMQT